MQFKEMVQKVLTNSETQELSRSDYFLISCFAAADPGSQPDEWIFTFYNSKQEQAITISYKNGNIKTGKKDVLLGKGEKLDHEKVEVAPEEAEATATRETGVKPTKTLFICHTKNKKPVWTLNLVSHQLKVISVNIDAQTNQIISKEDISLLPDKKKAG